MNTEKEIIKIGIIGAGDMGCLYAKSFYNYGWKNVYICDLPHNYDSLKIFFRDTGIKLLKDGIEISRLCDYIIYSVEAENLEKVVCQCGPSTKFGSIVSGQTSVKTPEINSFVKHLPADVHIITCHSMHGPRIDPENQPLAIINYRSTSEAFQLIVRILESLKSKIVHLNYEEHDSMTAITQATTHLAFISMGTAWRNKNNYPWNNPLYIGGIDNVKVNITLRIFFNKWHVYAGLAILNPSAKKFSRQYSHSVLELFQLMITENDQEFKERAGEYVFGQRFLNHKIDTPMILEDENKLDKFGLTQPDKMAYKKNSHLSLISMVDCWYQLKINPYDHQICQTPPFKAWFGIVEYLYRYPDLLDESIQTALYDKDIRPDDLCFTYSVSSWADVINEGSFKVYEQKFNDIRQFFEEKLTEGNVLCSKLFNDF